MDYERARQLLDEFSMTGALGNLRAVVLELLAEVQRLTENDDDKFLNDLLEDDDDEQYVDE